MNKFNYLLEHRSNVTSQYGEDGIIEEIFKIIPEQTHWCVEFGAWDGKRFSNTYNLINNHQWKGVLIEGEKEKFKDLLATYSSNKDVHCINKYIEIEGNNTLDQLLKSTPIPTDFDLLSVDIDGNDFHIWKSLKEYKPKCVLIEFNPLIPADIEFVQPKDPDLFQGTSLLSMQKLGKEKGYELICVNHENAFFVDQKYYPAFQIEDNSVEKIFDQKDSIRVFQLFDGTLVFKGGDVMPWHQLVFDCNSLQPLPKIFRNMPWKRGEPTLAMLMKRVLFRIYLKAKGKKVKMIKLEQ